MNEISQEEREQIIANIKGYIDNCKGFFGMSAARAIQADYDDDDECWNKLLVLIESAPAQQECIPCPLDADGVPCNIDDIVYCKDEEIWIEYCNSESIAYSDEKGYLRQIAASYVTHKKSRTLEDIKDEASECAYSSEEEHVKNLIREAFEMGRKGTENERPLRHYPTF